MRAISGLLLLLICLPVQATLVAVAPSRDGLVIAADSRLTFLGAQCDGAFKILVPARPMRTVAVVTGDSVFVAPPPAGTRDLCGYLAHAPRRLDLGAVVTQALERSRDDAAQVSLVELSSACVIAVEEFRHASPEALSGYAGRDLFSVVVVSYDAGQAASTLQRFVVRIDAGGNVTAADASETKFDAHSARDVWVYGETDWVKRAVFAGAGRHFLRAATLEFLHDRKPIAEVSTEGAMDAATNVIEAASRAAVADPPPSGIGGAIHVMVIGNSERVETVK